MPKLTVDGSGTFDVPDNKRLVLALIDEAKIDQLHTCIAKSLPNVKSAKTCRDDLR